MQSNLERRIASMKLPSPRLITVYPGVRPILDATHDVKPTAIYVKLRRQPTIVVHLGLLVMIDTHCFQETHEICWISTLSESGEVLTFVTAAAITSTGCPLLIA
jgi:hypothetical protein